MAEAQGRRTVLIDVGLAALLTLTAACRSKPAELDPYDAERVVMKAKPNAGAASAPSAADAVAQQARAEADLQAAEAAWRAGDALTTLATCNRALVAGVPAEMAPSFRDLRAKARKSLVATKVCRVRAVPAKDAVADGSPAPVTIEFTNLSGATLRVPRSRNGSSPAVVVLTLVREDYDVFGNERSSDATLSVPVEADLVLGPGATKAMPFEIPAEMVKLSHEGFSVIELRGVFRPVAIEVGESEFFDAIPIEPARIRVFLKGYEPLAEDPLGSLAKAVEKRSPPHLLTCVELLAPQDRAAARTLLTAAREKDPPLSQAIDAALARIAAER